MAMGTAFTLFFVPAIYLLVARDHSRGRVSAPAPAPLVSAPPQGVAAEAT
jgi:hypothetical protein